MKTMEGTVFSFGTSCGEISRPHGMTVRYFTERNGIFSANAHECQIIEAGVFDHPNFGKSVRITVNDPDHGICSWIRSFNEESESMLKKLYEAFEVASEEELVGKNAYCHFGFYATLLTIIDVESYSGLILGYNVVELK